MDLLSQGLLGSALAQSAAGPDKIRKAGLIGLLAGLSADLDILIRSDQDPLLNLEFHRHFTHSIFFIPVAALILSLLFWPFFRKHLGWPQLFLFALLGYSLSGFLDASTSYGTRLFWPLSDDRISFNIISIVDPIFTLLLIAGVLISLKVKNNKYVRFSVLLAAAYLSLGLLQHHRAQSLIHDYAAGQGHSPQRILVKPTLGNLLLWRAVYLDRNQFHVNALWINPFTGNGNIIDGEQITQFKAGEHDLPIAKDSTLQKDIERFAYFSDDYLAFHPDKPDRIIDVRFANLPHQIFPLWGIHFDSSQPQEHAHYELYRNRDKQTRDIFIHLLLNRHSNVPDSAD